VANTPIDRWSLIETNQKILDDFFGWMEQSVVKGYRVQTAYHRLDVVIIRPRFNTISMQDAPTLLSVKKHAASINDLGARVAAPRELGVLSHHRFKPIVARYTDERFKIVSSAQDPLNVVLIYVHTVAAA